MAYFAPTMERLRHALGEDGFAAAVEAGRDLSLEATMAEAIVLGQTALVVERETEGATDDRSGLTPREREVLRLVVEGLSDKEIGAALGISAQTVAKHVAHVLRKLDVSSRTAAATLATRRGLVQG
jgi:DNA-binding NarL/FixJ family response regulator